MHADMASEATEIITSNIDKFLTTENYEVGGGSRAHGQVQEEEEAEEESGVQATARGAKAPF